MSEEEFMSFSLAETVLARWINGWLVCVLCLVLYSLQLSSLWLTKSYSISCRACSCCPASPKYLTDARFVCNSVKNKLWKEFEECWSEWEDWEMVHGSGTCWGCLASQNVLMLPPDDVCLCVWECVCIRVFIPNLKCPTANLFHSFAALFFSDNVAIWTLTDLRGGKKPTDVL